MTYAEIMADPSVPYWARDLVPVLVTKDPVDVLNVLEVLTMAAAAYLATVVSGKGTQ